MAYKFEFNNKTLGGREFEKDSYRLIQEGLTALRKEVEAWNQKAKAHGAAPPYERESEYLERLIAFGSDELAGKSPYVRVNGISVGTMRFLRAGMELVLLRKKDELLKNRAAGAPSAFVESLRRSLENVQELAAGLGVPPDDLLWEVLPGHESGEIASQMRGETEGAQWDAFVSHASEDKDAFVRPLAEALQGAGLHIWYDEFSLRVGDSLRRSIDRGLSQSRYGIVVLSPSFFAKEWPQKELDGLVAREGGGERFILPVWHKVGIEDVRRYSPILADRVATQSRKGLADVVKELLAVLKPGK